MDAAGHFIMGLGLTHIAVGRNAVGQPDIAADDGAATHDDATQYRGAGIDNDVILEDRIAYIGHGGVAWWGGWLLWHAAAIALLALYAGLAGIWWQRGPIRCAVALLCAAAGQAADLTAETIYIGLLPGLRRDMFPAGEMAAGLLTGYLGNGLYTLAGILITWVGARELPRALLALGSAVWLGGLVLAAVSLARSPGGQTWSTALLMPLFILWSGLLGRWLGTRPS